MAGKFIDKVRIFVKGGNGGAGCMSFRREAHVPKGGPDGGDGGHGGNVILVADGGKSSLIEYRYRHHFNANRGTHGKGSRMHGQDGNDVILRVPVGTVVKEVEFSDDAFAEDDMTISYDGEIPASANPQKAVSGKIIADLQEDGKQIVIAKGGTGGRGNTHFVTPTRRAPQFAELGEPSQGKWIELEMKLMADAALVGMPSSGKSSLISRLSAAKPKVADYPFTTLTPNLGVAKSGNYSYVLADIPGLIKDAHIGKGLGHEFLRHIERSALIVHVVDMTGSWEGRDPVEDFKTIQNELSMYVTDLSLRPQIVVANKTDIPETKEDCKRLQAAVNDLFESCKGTDREGIINSKVFNVSAITGKGLDELNKAIAYKVKELRQAQADKLAENKKYDKVWTLLRTTDDEKFSIVQLEKGVFEVKGKRPVRAVVQTDLDNEEAIVFLQHRLKKMGVESELAKWGAIDGDEIIIAGRSFEFENTESATNKDEWGDLE